MSEEASMFDSSNIGIAKGREGGYAAVAPAGTDPSIYEDVTKTIKELCEAEGSVLESLGYVDEDGVQIASDISKDDKTDWAGDTIASTLKSFSENIQVGFLESRKSVLGVVYGAGNVSSNGAITMVRHNKNFTAERVYVFDCVISDTKVKRTIVPAGVIDDRDDVSENNADMLTYKPTIKCLSTKKYGGDIMRDFIYDATYVDPDESE